MATRFRDLIGPAMFEAAFVVFGVVVAYAANEWRETRVHRQDAAAARTAIRRELQQNRTAAQTSLAYHKTLMDSIVGRLRSGKPSDLGLFSRGFLMPAQLGHTAWDVAAQTGALNHMPYDDVLRFSRMYADQRRYDDQSTAVGGIIYTALYTDGSAAVGQRGQQLMNLIATFRYREVGLVAAYDSLLATPAPGQNSPRPAP